MILRMIFGAIIGVGLGFVYYKVVGCSTGTCPITKSPITSSLYGAVMGILISII